MRRSCVLLGFLLYCLASSCARAGDFPVQISAGSLRYSDMDRAITGRIAQFIANNPKYSLLQSDVQYVPPHAEYLITYTDLQDGTIAVALIILWEAPGQRFPGWLSSGVTFCSTRDNSQCVLDALSILQVGYAYFRRSFDRVGAQLGAQTQH